MDDPTTNAMSGYGERSRGRGRSGSRPNPADKRQLESNPVNVGRILALFKPYKARIALVIALIVASSVVGLGQPFLVRTVIDDALANSNVHLLILCVLAMVGIAVVTAILGVLQTWLSTAMGQQIMHRLRTDLFTHLQRQSVAFFTRTRGGEVQSRLINDVGGIQTVVTSTATSIAANVAVVIGTVLAMVALSWRLSLLSLLVLPPAIWLTRQVAKMRYTITAERQARLADLHVQIEEGLSVSGVLLTKTIGSAPALVSRFEDTSQDLVGLEIRSSLAGRWRMATMNIIFAAIPAAIYLVAGLPATSRGMTIGTLVAFSALQGTLFRPLMGLLNVGVDITASLALFSRIFEYQDLPVEIADPSEPLSIEAPRGDVTFDQLSFAYDDESGEILSDINLHVPAGTTLALVGETGSGKSTLAAMVARLQDPTTGRVLIDGTDLRDLRLTDLADLVGVVTQDTYLLHASIRENLLQARPAATEAEVEEACRSARIHDLIVSLPQGYDTLVGSRGHRFSGGEKQRLAIARTLLRDPRVLILDEATSALDNETERAVQAALDDASRGRTTITIAHRLSTVRNADQIAVLDHGRVVELGTHEELLLEGGKYADLVRGGLENRTDRTLAA
jgi:ATP-binding cassette subfamily B protein